MWLRGHACWKARPEVTPGFKQSSGRHIESLWRQQSEASWDQSGQKSRDERQLTQAADLINYVTTKPRAHIHKPQLNTCVCRSECVCMFWHTNTIRSASLEEQGRMSFLVLFLSVLSLAAVHPNRWASVTGLLLTGHLALLWHGDQSILYHSQWETHHNLSHTRLVS